MIERRHYFEVGKDKVQGVQIGSAHRAKEKALCFKLNFSFVYHNLFLIDQTHIGNVNRKEQANVNFRVHEMDITFRPLPFLNPWFEQIKFCKAHRFV